MKVNKTGGYLNHIEGLRALAAVMVMLFHFITFQTPTGFVVESASVRNFAGFGAQGVELFYIISGCVIILSLTKSNYQLSDYPRYLLKRLIRILPAYLATIACICILAALWSGDYPYTAKQILQNCTFTVDLFEDGVWLNPIFSTLKIELMFYIAIGVLFPLLRKYRWVAFLLIPAFYITEFYFPEMDALKAAPYFVIGGLVAPLLMNQNNRLNWIYLAVCVLGLIPNYLAEDLIIVGLALLFLLFVKMEFNWLVFMGKFSYSIYLLHGLVGGTFLYFVTQEKYGALNGWLAIALAIPIALICSYIFYLCVEKQSLKLIQSAKLKRSSSVSRDAFSE